MGSGERANVNEVLAQELRKPVIKTFKKRKICKRFKDILSTADIAEIKPLSSKN